MLNSHTPKVEVTKYIRGEAYARNGNAHRPTKYFGWAVALDGRPYGLFARWRDAIEAVPALIAEWRERNGYDEPDHRKAAEGR